MGNKFTYKYELGTTVRLRSGGPIMPVELPS
jgi:hypothetical protein